MLEIIEDRLLRLPYLQPRNHSQEPLTVLFSLLTRSVELSRDHLNSPGVSCRAFPTSDQATTSADQWGAYWRQVHAPCFIHTDEAGDNSIERLHRYVQLHRFAPGPSQVAAPPYNVCLDQLGTLWSSATVPKGTRQRPHWDGASYLTFSAVDDIPVVFGAGRTRQRVLADDQSIFQDLAPILAREYIIIPSSTANETIVLVKLHVRSLALDRVTFHHRWLNEHGDVIRSNANSLIKRYVQLHNVGPTKAGKPFFHPDASWIDGVTLMSFTSMNDIEDFFRSAEYRAIAQSEALISNVGASEWWTAISIGIVDRIGREEAGDPPKGETN
ncbi:hypothetical protein EGJ27_02465 [Pseudomonas sp. v388]|uniref:EthD domain-containing protein n=1 Tax=Pseudomonas sp. v388 TaxID=2479849 RepID=UPI000F7A855F|nr:EthD domain-containing protein [Pseudomonas sp. v388]RRV10505.1 hypothetical protein EGJ27_02465 [Pseudomonas sp. v388]